VSTAHPPNLHATALVLGRTGLIVVGRSGSGKTELCLNLLAACRAEGVFARLVCDDQVLLSSPAGRLVATAPQTIAGLVELRGYGPAPAAHIGSAVIDRIIRMEPTAPRMPEPATERIHGIELPLLCVASDPGERGVRAVLGWLGMPPFKT
jgi:serine kinase of HPr protein (carbohydrate metabolism regulator)